MSDPPLTSHSLRFLELAFRTDRHRSLARPSGKGRRRGDCGDSVEMELAVRNGRIEAVTFQVSGCLNTNACANAVAELAEGTTVEAAWILTADRIAAHLQSLPPDHFHCAELAVGAFYRALADCARQNGNAWKAAYRKGAG